MMRIEVTYLCKTLPKDLKSTRHEKIEQGYFSDRVDPVRVRDKGGVFSFTKKTLVMPNDFSLRDYATIEISKEEFDKVWPITTKKLQKTRYYYHEQIGGADVRIDMFEDKLKGLVLIELVFADENGLRDFKAPEWFGPEVTKEAKLTNPEVAGKSFAQIKPVLKKYIKD